MLACRHAALQWVWCHHVVQHSLLMTAEYAKIVEWLASPYVHPLQRPLSALTVLLQLEASALSRVTVVPSVKLHARV